MVMNGANAIKVTDRTGDSMVVLLDKAGSDTKSIMQKKEIEIIKAEVPFKVRLFTRRLKSSRFSLME